MECEGTDIDPSPSRSIIWNKIELAESLLVCCMYEEAASLAFSVEKLIFNVRCREIDDAAGCYSMMEAAGMVLVQSWNELGRTGEIVDGLRRLHGSIKNIPVSVLLTGVCFQLAEGCTHNLPEFLQAYLSAWKYVDGHYVSATIEAVDEEGHFILECDKYFEVAETYIITLLEVSPNNVENVISWVAKSALPEDKCQILLERVHSLCLPKPADGHKPHSGDLQQQEKQCAKLVTNEEHGMISLRSLKPVTWVLPQLRTKRFSTSNGWILFGCLMLLMFYVVRRKRDILKMLLRRQSGAVKRALIDLWQLAFSHQVNPLAAGSPRSPLLR